MKKVLSILLAVVILLSAITVAIPVISSAKHVTCPFCYGSGRLDCITCRGSGYNTCPSCYGAGGYSGYTGWNRCLRCFGQGRLICPKCQSRGYNVCTGCDGKGYYEDYSGSSSGSGSSSSSGSHSSSSSSRKPATVAKPPKTSISKIISREAGFSVSWKKQTKNTTGYQIQYATNNKFSGGKAKAIKGKTNTTVTGLTGGKRYYVRVRTYRTYGGKNYFSAWSAAKSFVTKKVAKPAATSISKFVSRAYGFSVSWAKRVKNLTGYQIQYATNNKFTGGKAKAVKGKTNTTITGLKGGKRYYVRVRTYRTLNGKNYFSAWSAVKSVVTKKVTAPSVPYITTFETGYYYKSNGAPAPTIYFQKISDCKGYQLQTSTYSDFRSGSTTELYTCPYNSCGSDWDMCYTYTGDYKWGWYLPSGSNEYSVETAEEDNPLKCDTTYYFRIRAYKTVDGTNYYSGWSQTVSSTW